jgi:hypothetical protein
LAAVPLFGSEAPKRSVAAFDFALFFNGLDISLHILRVLGRCESVDLTMPWMGLKGDRGGV